MRNREGLQHQAAFLRDELEFMEQSRLPHPRFAHHTRDLPMSCFCLLQGSLQMLSLALPAHEPHQAALSGNLHPGAERPYPQHLINLDRLTDAFDLRCTQGLELKVTFGE